MNPLHYFHHRFGIWLFLEVHARWSWAWLVHMIVWSCVFLGGSAGVIVVESQMPAHQEIALRSLCWVCSGVLAFAYTADYIKSKERTFLLEGRDMAWVQWDVQARLLEEETTNV